MKRTAAAFTILVGLTAMMIGLYIGEFTTLSEILRTYAIPLP